MKVKLIENPWYGTEDIPHGLTIGKVYECIDSFLVNSMGDEYYVIIDDNNTKQSWNKYSFEIVEEDKEVK